MRDPSLQECIVFEALLSVDFPGKLMLREMISNAKVQTIDENGSLRIETAHPGKADVIKQIPVEGMATDTDGISAHALLHVRDGVPVELEIYKDDGSPISSIDILADMEIIVLAKYPD